MAEYNQLMNQRLIEAATNVSKEELIADKGAFFGSILGTLNHILVGDILWLKRFYQHSNTREILAFIDQIENPKRLDSQVFDDIKSLTNQRIGLDKAIILLCQKLTIQDLDGTIEYSNMRGEKYSKRFGDLMLHLFLHQIHHRGQITTLLSQEGIDFGETDLIEII